MELEGWKLLLLVRLSPVVPYNLLNIAMATTPIHFWQFAFVSAIGTLQWRPKPLKFASVAKKIAKRMPNHHRILRWTDSFLQGDTCLCRSLIVMAIHMLLFRSLVAMAISFVCAAVNWNGHLPIHFRQSAFIAIA